MYRRYYKTRFGDWRAVLTVLTFFFLSCCAPVAEDESITVDKLTEIAANPLPPEQTKELLQEVGANWFYGEGLGDTALNVGAAVFFPPYGLLLLGNSVLSISGYRTFWLSDALPDEERAAWKETYGAAASVPGRFTASIANREFRTKEVIKEDLKRYLVSDKNSGIKN